MKRAFVWSPKMRIVIVLLISILFTISIGTLWWQTRHYRSILMLQHLQQLATIFNNIHRTAGIENFEHQANYIDFLNVKKFEGSTLGSMNLRYPDRWRGPYVIKNPTIQEKYYEIIQTNEGYFIVPGTGVKLANGKIVGVDIIFTSDSDLISLMNDPEQLNARGQPLAVQIATHNKPIEINDVGIDPYQLLGDSA